MAEYFLVIDGVGENKSGHEIEEIKIDETPYISGLVKGEPRFLTIQKKPGYFTSLMRRYYYGGTPILKIRLMLVKSEHYEFSDSSVSSNKVSGNKTITTRITTQTSEFIPDDRTNPYTFLDCRVLDMRESDNGYFQITITFEYSTVIKNTPTLPKPILPDKKPAQAKAAR